MYLKTYYTVAKYHVQCTLYKVHCIWSIVAIPKQMIMQVFVTDADRRLPPNWLNCAVEPVLLKPHLILSCTSVVATFPPNLEKLTHIYRCEQPLLRPDWLSRAEEPVSFACHLLHKCYAIQATYYQTAQLHGFFSYILNYPTTTTKACMI